MRHAKKFNHLSRKSAHRKAMLSNMSCSLIEHKRIKTTKAKAKALRIFVEPILTRSKTDTLANRRECFSKLRNKYAVKELFGEIAPKILERKGGYTRIIKLGVRKGDDAEMVFMELVDFNDTYNAKQTKPKRTRRRTKAKKKTETSEEVKTVEIEKEPIDENDSAVENTKPVEEEKKTIENKEEGKENNKEKDDK